MSSKSSRGQLVFRSSLYRTCGRRGDHLDDFRRACVTGLRLHDPSHARRWSSDHPHGKGQRSGGSSKRPKGGLGTSRGHPVPPPRGFGPVRGGHRGRRDGPQHEAPFLVIQYMTTTVKGLIVYSYAYLNLYVPYEPNGRLRNRYSSLYFSFGLLQ